MRGRKVVYKGALVLLILALACFFTGVGSALAQAQKPAAEQPKEQAKTVGENLGLSGKLGEAVAKTPVGKGPGLIDANAPKGAFGIPGLRTSARSWPICWAVWVGWIFSTVGAFGGIMAGVGHITVYGLGDYAKTFAKTNPDAEQDPHRQHPDIQPVPGRPLRLDQHHQLPEVKTPGLAPGYCPGARVHCRRRLYSHPDRRQDQLQAVPGMVRRLRLRGRSRPPL